MTLKNLHFLEGSSCHVCHNRVRGCSLSQLRIEDPGEAATEVEAPEEILAEEVQDSSGSP